ncbi:MAG TPA: HEAT repeat domain-containing protein [Candidatus Limnocylindria bacterium]|nr:HEAT repeat domain-containing protein [Candidatus Limnocylindria bacterium]
MRTPAFLQTRVERLERASDVPGIIAVLADRTEKTYERAHAAKALADLTGRLGDDRAAAVAVLLQAADEPTAVRRWALLALAELHEASALPAFQRAAHDGDWMVRIFAAHGFDRLRSHDSLVEVIGLLADRESGVREAAAAALASIGDGRVRPLLERAAVTDPYPWVREAARDALAVLGRSSGLPPAA